MIGDSLRDLEVGSWSIQNFSAKLIFIESTDSLKVVKFRSFSSVPNLPSHLDDVIAQSSLQRVRSNEEKKIFR